MLNFVRNIQLKPILLQLVAGLILYVLARLGLQMSSLSGGISPVWPAAGFGISALIHLGPRSLPILFVAVWTYNTQIGNPLLVSLAMTAVTLSEYFIGSWIYKKINSIKFDLFFFRSTLAVTLSSSVAALFCALLGTSALYLGGVISASIFSTVALTWWVGDTLGGLIVIPFVLRLRGETSAAAVSRLKTWIRVKFFDLFFLMCAGYLLLRFLLFSPDAAPFMFVAFPFFLILFIRLGVTAGYFSVICFAGISYASTFFQAGFFSLGNVTENIMNLQLFLAALALTAQLISAYLESGSILLTGLALMSGWILSGVLFYSFYSHATQQSLNQYFGLIDEILQKTETQKQLSFTALQGGVSFFSASNSVERLEWRAYTKDLKLEKNLSGLRGLGVIFRVPTDKLSSFVTQTRKDNAADFTYKKVPNAIEDSANLKEAFVITYLEPIAANQKAIGLDVATEDQRRVNAELARDTGEPTISGPIHLIQDNISRTAFLMFMPFYKKNAELNSVDSRRKNLIGWIYSPVVSEDFFKSILSSERNFEDLSVAVFHGKDSSKNLVFKSNNFDQTKSRNQVDRLIRLANQDFYIQVRMPSKLAVQADMTSSWFGFAGVLITLLLSALVDVLFYQKSHSDHLVQVKRKSLEQSYSQIADQQNRLTAASKMAALGEMASGIAHEINNPLTVIMARTEILLQSLNSEGVPPEVLRANLEKIEATTQRIGKIISGLRNFAREGSKDPKELIVVEKVLQESLAICQEKLLYKQVELKADFSNINSNMFILGHAVQISQVMINLIGNSIDAIEKENIRWIRIVAKKNAQMLELEVSDSGPGIPQEVQLKMMQPFFTTKGVGKGTGLGLSISRTIINDHGGELSYIPNKGNTCFLIRLPLVNAAA